eukprot:5555145-Prymnesium_polylepis.1
MGTRMMSSPGAGSGSSTTGTSATVWPSPFGEPDQGCTSPSTPSSPGRRFRMTGRLLSGPLLKTQSSSMPALSKGKSFLRRGMTRKRLLD